MTNDRLQELLNLGENIAIEFKRCGNGIESDTYQTVCSFLNRFGGDILLGVEDNGRVTGVPKNAALDIVKNFISNISNGHFIVPTVYLEPKILDYHGKTIIHIHVPQDSEIHSLKGVIFDRVEDSDVKLTSTSQITALGIRKQNIFTEQKVYPHVSLKDLRIDLLPRVRLLAKNHTLDGQHPWASMTDMELLKSAGLYKKDVETGKNGFNLAAIMLLGRDELIRDICPCYKTDALFRKINVDRYDDRKIVQTNLIDSYMELTEFAAKHLLDKFYLEGEHRLSLAGVISREMLSNTLIHREFSSHFPARFVIMKDEMFVENACRAKQEIDITPDNLVPDSKNPTIASFFRNIGLADELGSGVRRLFKYVPLYSNAIPTMKEADIFRITVPLNDLYSYDLKTTEGVTSYAKQGEVNAKQGEVNAKQGEVNAKQGEVNEKQGEVSKNVIKLLRVLGDNQYRILELCIMLKIKKPETVRSNYVKKALNLGLIEQTQPKSPHSPTQKYRLTTKGHKFLEDIGNNIPKV